METVRRYLPRRRLISYFWLLINTLCWGAALIIVKPAFETTTAFRFLLYRYAGAALLGLPWLLHYWPKVETKIKHVPTIVHMELLGTSLTLGLLYVGLDKTSAIEASFISTTTPIFLVAFGIWLLRERQELREWLGLGIAFFGTLLLTFLPVLANGGITHTSLVGNLLIIGQNITTSLYFVLAKKYYRTLPPLFVTSISFFVGLVSFFVLSLFEVSWSLPKLSAVILSDLSQIPVLIAAGYMALFGSIIGLTAYLKGQAGVEASEASVFWYLQPLVYVPLGIVLLKDTVSIWQALSLGVILIGVLIASWKTVRQAKPKRRQLTKSKKHSR